MHCCKHAKSAAARERLSGLSLALATVEKLEHKLDTVKHLQLQGKRSGDSAFRSEVALTLSETANLADEVNELWSMIATQRMELEDMLALLAPCASAQVTEVVSSELVSLSKRGAPRLSASPPTRKKQRPLAKTPKGRR